MLSIQIQTFTFFGPSWNTVSSSHNASMPVFTDALYFYAKLIGKYVF